MALFRRRKITNTAESVLPLPPPTNQIVHHHSINWPGIIIAAAVCAIIFLPILWLFWVSLFAQLGRRQPEREAAFWAISLLLAPVAALTIRWVLLAILDSWFSYRLEVQKEITERKRIELLAIQSSLDPGRMTEADFQFAQVILAVMNEVYFYIEKHNAPFKGRGRPWSVRSVLDIAKAMGITITQDQAGQVVKWLRSNNVIIGELDGQVNVGQYPDLGTVRALLDSKFGKPITVNRFPPLRDNWGFDHI